MPRLLAWSLVGVLIALPAARADAPVAELIRGLSSEDFMTRENAWRALEKLGPTALPALQPALGHGDPEVRRRVSALVQSFEERELTAVLLHARKVRIRLDKMPEREAAGHLMQQTGLQVRCLTTDPRQLLTIDTGTLPLWEAWAALRRGTGLEETLDSHYHIALLHGQGRAPAEDVRGPFRIRIWTRTRDAHVSIHAEIRGDPELQIDFVGKGRLTSLRGARGQALTLPPDVEVTSADDESIREPSPRQLLVVADAPSPGGDRFAAIEGEFVVQARVPRPLVAVDSVLRSVGKTQFGSSGMGLKVLQAELTDEGDLSVRARLYHLSALPPPEPGKEVVRVRPGVIAVRGPADAALDHLELHDALGRIVPRVQATRETSSDDDAEYHLVFQPRSGQTDGLRLSVAGRRMLRLPVRFAVRDVRLPD